MTNTTDRKPRILWASVNCLLDSSSGASMSVRQMLRQLAAAGSDIRIIGATIFDALSGRSHFEGDWSALQAGFKQHKVLECIDGSLRHKLLSTASHKREQMTAGEQEIWQQYYLQTLDRFKPDLVFFYGGYSFDWLIPQEARARGIPSVAYLANSTYSGVRWNRDVDLVLTDTKATADLYASKEGFQATPVGKFIDPDTVVSATHSRRHLLFVNPTLEKGALLVAHLAVLLGRQRPDIVIEVVESRGIWEPIVKLAAQQLSLAQDALSNVMVTPHSNDMRSAYSRARLLLVPSLCWESGSRIIVEALLNGIPVVATERGGTTEVMGAGGVLIQLPASCYKAPYKDLPGLQLLQPIVEQLVRFYDDETLYQDYTARALQEAGARHNLEKNGRRLSQILQPLLQRQAGDGDLGANELGQHQQGPRIKTFRACLELISNPASTSAELLEQAAGLHRKGEFDLAHKSYLQVLAREPAHADALHALGVLLLQSERASEALPLIERALVLSPDSAAFHSSHGIALKESGRDEAALASFDRALALNPGLIDAWLNRAYLLRTAQLLPAAQASYESALALQPDDQKLLRLLAQCAREAGDMARALQACERLLLLAPDSFRGWGLHGQILQAQGQFDAALASIAHALELQPDHPRLVRLQVQCQREQGDFPAALAACEKLLQLTPEDFRNWCLHGKILKAQGRNAEALASFDRALVLKPDHAETWFNRGLALTAAWQWREAMESYRKVTSLLPGEAIAWKNQGIMHRMQGEYDQAIACLQQAFTLDPDSASLRGQLFNLRMVSCNWEHYEEELAALLQCIAEGKPVAPPFTLQAACIAAAPMRKVAELYVAKSLAETPPQEPWGSSKSSERIRIGYYSADFHNHATAFLMAELFELHDKSRFELIAFSFGPNRQDMSRRRIMAAFDQFHDVRDYSDAEIVALSRKLGIDIAVDLKGFTLHSRVGIFIRRAAPVQVNWLGYPGTLGFAAMDYILADPVLIPELVQAHYSEKVVWLPHSYQVNDRHRAIAPQCPGREQMGLPETGFVFCCFNNNYKITPEQFAAWMRILQAVPDSVLWLLQGNTWSAANLRRAAQQHGVDPARLVFATRANLAEHLARQQLADLFLDTFPCNAHTTASDALWAGLPLVTLCGETFASRVAASLLQAVGLPELITESRQEYEQLAVQLAFDKPRLLLLREKLAHNRLQTPLFDTPLFTRHLEQAFSHMHERHLQGLPPTPFKV